MTNYNSGSQRIMASDPVGVRGQEFNFRPALANGVCAEV